MHAATLSVTSQFNHLQLKIGWRKQWKWEAIDFKFRSVLRNPHPRGSQTYSFIPGMLLKQLGLLLITKILIAQYQPHFEHSIRATV